MEEDSFLAFFDDKTEHYDKVVPLIYEDELLEAFFYLQKTSLLYFVRDQMAVDPEFMEKNKADICASFQKALIDILMDKLIKAAKDTGIKQITIGGGVSANSGLRTRIVEEGRKRGWTTFLPEFKFTTDNAAMIAIAGWFHYQNGERSSLDVAPVSRLAEF